MHTPSMKPRVRLLVWLVALLAVMLPGRVVLQKATAQSVPAPAWIFYPACDSNGTPCRINNIPPCGPAPWTNSAGNPTCGAGTVIATEEHGFKVCGTPNASTTPCTNISVICGREAVCQMHATPSPVTLYCAYTWSNVYGSGCAQ
jgi:hypothetical protein